MRLVVPISHVDPPPRIDHQVVGQPELPRTGSPLTPPQHIFSVRRKFDHPCTAVAVADVDIAIGREGNIGGQIEMLGVDTRLALDAKLQDHAPFGVSIL